MDPERRTTGIFRWLWLSYARTALVPLLLIEIALVVTYLVTHNIMAEANVSVMREEARNRLIGLVGDQGAVIGAKLDTVMSHTAIFRQAAEHVLANPAEPAPAEAARYASGPDGVYYTPADDGGAALFYSGHVPVGERERRKAWQSAALDPLMRQIKAASPLVMQLYLNTHDSMNRIYPFFDVLSQYPPRMAIPEYNFYYEADAAHNPDRKVVWTDVYLDPAGQGWMASCIAPVYRGDFLEGVVGLDVTVESFIRQVLDLEIPWEGYALLVDRNGGIMAMPPAAEQDLGLRELTSHHYSEAIAREELKPETFNIRRNERLRGLADEIAASGAAGVSAIELNGAKLAAWSTIGQTGWKLLAFVPEANIYAQSNALAAFFRKLGFAMITGMVVFYLGFFAFLYLRARRMAKTLCEPIVGLARMAEDIGRGNYVQATPQISVRELQTAAEQLVGMGRALGEINQSLRASRDVAERASNAKSAFMSRMTHELRTPLNAILGFTQLLAFDSERLSPEHREFVHHIEHSARQLLAMLDEVLEVTRAGTPDAGSATH
jgi:hypothetical protein